MLLIVHRGAGGQDRKREFNTLLLAHGLWELNGGMWMHDRVQLEAILRGSLGLKAKRMRYNSVSGLLPC